jgi:hypothetical protein
MAPVSQSEFEKWERALCNHFLAVLDGDASPIRSIEITRYTLVASRQGEFSDTEEAVCAFREALDIDDVCSAVEHGRYRRLDRIGLPGCFSYLALTLFVDSLIDDDAERVGAFRAKLAGFLRVDRAFSNLTGVAEMWRSLAHWLDARVDNGGNYRRLVLPDPGSWTHIGYTARLSFPSRRDKALLRAFLLNSSRTDGPAAFLTKFRNVAAGPKASWALKEAFDEFQKEFLAGRRTLADHRFWGFVQEVTAGLKATEDVVLRSVDLAKDQDDEWSITIEVGEGERQHFDELGTATAKLIAMPNELTTSCNRGFLVFRQIGNATWRAVPDLSECIGRVMIGLSAVAASRVGRRLGKLEQSGSWVLTKEPVAVSVAERAAAVLGLAASTRDYIVPVSVLDGQRTGSFWLGRPPFLPHVNADNDELSVRAENDTTGSIRCVADERTPGVFKLSADSPVGGSFLISPNTKPGGIRPWTRRVTFVADALIHEAIRAPAASDHLVEWDGPQAAPVAMDIRPTWDDRTSLIDDLIEAVYAGGKTGWNEMDLVALVRRGLGIEVNPWDVIRSLQEATCLKPMLRAQWRGRLWNLEQPSLRVIGNVPIVVVDGCISARRAVEFRRAAEAAGGSVFRRAASAMIAPPLLGCVGADVAQLSEVLRWPRCEEAIPSSGKLAFRLTERRPERYELRHRWSFEAGCFVRARGQPISQVILERWVHPGARDHDLYVVSQQSRSWHLLSRPAAVAFAYCLAGRPLFEFSDGLLKRTAREGALPDGLAALARYRHLANPGVTERRYAYVTDRQFVQQLAGVLPNLVQGLKDSGGNETAEAVSLVLHSGGRIRAAWKKGSLSTTHS